MLYSKEKSESEGGVTLLFHNSVGSSVKGKKKYQNWYVFQLCNGPNL